DPAAAVGAAAPHPRDPARRRPAARGPAVRRSIPAVRRHQRRLRTGRPDRPPALPGYPRPPAAHVDPARLVAGRYRPRLLLVAGPAADHGRLRVLVHAL